MSDITFEGFNMTGSEFLTKLKRLAKKMGTKYEFKQERGRGSHGTVYLGHKMAVIPNRKKEIKKGTLNAICNQLDIKVQDLYGD